jgi:hypothetical protein
MIKISDRDLAIWNNIKASINHVPSPVEVIRKYKEQKKAGLYSIPGARIGARFVSVDGNLPYDKIWALTVMAELNSFFCTLEKKYGFSGHTHTFNEEGFVVPIDRNNHKLF